jgi:hypothetical protein
MAKKRDLSGLVEHLRRQTVKEFDMTFEEIEALVGGLPMSAKKYEQWWENGAASANRPQRIAMLQTPYDSYFRPRSAPGKVRFERRR